MMLLDQFTAVSRVKTREELFDELVRFMRWLGFRTMSAMVVVDHLQRESEFIHLNNTPPEALELSDPAYARMDPVMQHCKRASVPIIWKQDTYTTIGHGERWEALSSHGFCAGIAFANHLPDRKHFFISVDRDQGLPADTAELTRMVAHLQLFAAQAQDAALRVLLPSMPQGDFADLTSRELESLRWTMEGKTAWEVGRILGISEQTVVRHLNNATRKLDCVNKHHAAIKALRLGLVR